MTIPLIHPLYPCKLIYSIPYVNLNLEIFKNIHIINQERSVIITPQILFDYDHLCQVIISNLNQVKAFGRKIDFCVSSAFSRKFTGTKYVQLYIQNIPLE